MTDVQTHPGWTRWRAGQIALSLWLLVSPLLYPDGASAEVVLKDVLGGTVLGLVTLAAAAGVRPWVRAERGICLGLGLLLLSAALLLDDGVGSGSIVARWNEVVIAVLLVCVAAGRTRG